MRPRRSSQPPSFPLVEPSPGATLGDRLLIATEVAEFLSVPRGRVYELERLGILRSIRLGRSVRFSPIDIDQFLKAGGSLGPIAGASTAQLAVVTASARRREGGA